MTQETIKPGVAYKVWVQMEKIVTTKADSKPSDLGRSLSRSSYENLGPPVELIDTDVFEDADSFMSAVEQFAAEDGGDPKGHL